MPPSTTSIVVSFETRDATMTCVESLLRGAGPGDELIVVDNASTDGTAAAIAQAFPNVRVLEQAKNVGFGRAANRGARAATGSRFFFVNSDCVVRPEALGQLGSFLDDHPDAAVAVPRLLFADGTVQRNITRLPRPSSIAAEYLLGRVDDSYRAADLEEPLRVESCSGAALLIRRDDFWAADGFHEEYFMYVEDVELCRRLAERGRAIFYVPGAVAVHADGLSSRPRAAELAAMLERHREDYVRRTMSPSRAIPSLAAMRAGRRVAPARNRLLRLARPSAPAASDLLTDARVGHRVIRGGAQRAAALVVANLVTVVGAVVLLRYLGVEDFGRYGTVLALVGIVQGISDAGLTATGTRELALCETDTERRDVLAHVLGLRIALTAAGAAAAVGFAVLAGYSEDLVLGTLLAGAGVFLTSVQTAMILPLSVDLRNGAIALMDVARQVVLVTVFALLAAGGAGLVAFCAAQIPVGIVLLAVTPVLLASHDRVAPRWTAARIRALATIGLPVAAATVLGVLYLRLLVVLMSLVSDQEEQIGYFVTSTRVFEVVGGLPFLLGAVVLPVLTAVAREDHKRLVYMTGRITQLMALAGVLVALVVWTLAEPLIVLLGGEQYEPAAPVLQVQCFAAITIFVIAGWQPALFGMGRVRSSAVAMAVGVVAVCAAGVVLIPAHGAMGAAIAAVIGDVVLCAAVFFALRRAGPGPWISLSGTARIAAAAAVAVGIGLIPEVPDLLRAVAVTGAFAAAALLFRAVPHELVEAARRYRPWAAG